MPHNAASHLGLDTVCLRNIIANEIPPDAAKMSTHLNKMDGKCQSSQYGLSSSIGVTTFWKGVVHLVNSTHTMLSVYLQSTFTAMLHFSLAWWFRSQTQ